MGATRVEIFRDGLWRKLRLQDGKAIKYNALINRIGKIDSREISHTNTFSLLSIFQNTDALGINNFNKTELAKALNSKFLAKYYVEDKLLQQGFLVINNTSDGEINVNFIDEALELTEKWGSTTFKELLENDLIIKPQDYRLAILEMTNYDMSKTEVLAPLSQVGSRGYNLALFPNALNAIGDNFQKPINGDRLDNTFNPYQSRAIYNAKALFDLAVESFGYQPEYDSSIDWEAVANVFMIEEGLDQNKIEEEGQVKITYPVVGLQYASTYTGRKGSGTKLTVFNFIEDGNNRIRRPNDIANWTDPPSGQLQGGDVKRLDRGLDYHFDHCILVPETASATFGEIVYKAKVYPGAGDAQWHEAYACWENVTGGGILWTTLQGTDEIIEGDTYGVTIQKDQLVNHPSNSTGKLLGVLVAHLHRFHTRNWFFRDYYFQNITVTEKYLLANIVSYDEYGQYVANAISLQHSTPNKTIKELLSAIMQKEGILLNINSKTKKVKFFSYSIYRDNRDNGIFVDWSDYFQEYVSPIFNTDYGDSYAKKNEIGLTEPYLGNTYNYFLQNQGADSKYKAFTQNKIALFKDVEDIKRINNSVSPYYEYRNLGLGLVEKTGTISNLMQVSSNGTQQGIISDLQLVANINYATLPAGVREWYNLVDQAIRGNCTFMLPVDKVSDLDLSVPVYVENLGGFFIIEEVEEYVDASTPVLVKLIKLIEPILPQIVLPSVTEFVGVYSGSSQYSATLVRVTSNNELQGTYIGSSNYSATLFFDFPDKDLQGNYVGSSTYLAELTSSISLKFMQGQFNASSSYSAKLLIEKKKYLLRTDDTFTGTLNIEGEAIVTEKVHVPEILLNDHSLTWSDRDRTMSIDTGVGTSIQVGQETLIHVHNATGYTLLDGRVVYSLETITNGRPNVEYAIANSHETIINEIGLLTGDILPGQDGFMAVRGVIRDIDTSSLTVGSVYLSATIAGTLTSTKPRFPNYATLVGTTLISDSTLGSVLVDIKNNIYDTLNDAWNGTIRESFTAPITSDGTNVTLTLVDEENQGKLTLMLSSGISSLMTPLVINLPVGTSTIPKVLYIYILASTKTLTYSELGFPLTVEHIKIASAIIQSAVDVASDGPLKIRFWNDEVQRSTDQQGHIAHITERLRQENARYSSGCDFVNTVTATSNKISVTAGLVYLLHKQFYLAKDMSTGGFVHVVNHSTTPYIKTADLNSVTNDALGATLSNSSFSFVLWGIANSSGLDSKLMINLPIGSYAKNAPETAVSDPLNYSVYTIPRIFNGTGFLIARFTYIKQANGDWTLHATQDLRGSLIGVSGGASGGGSGVTAFQALTDTPSSYLTFANWLVRVDSSEAGLQYIEPKTSILTNVGEDGINKYLDTLDLGVNVQPYSSQVAFKNVDNNFTAAQTAPNYFSNNIATQNSHLVRLDQLNAIVSGIRWSDSVDSIFNNTSALPSSPTNKDRYIAQATANGWIINNIYEWTNTQWIEVIAEQGTTIAIHSLDSNYTFNGTSWVEFGSTLTHNNLTGLQGGAASQYYHLTATQHSNLTAIDTSNIAYKNQANTFLFNQTISAKLFVSSSIKMGDDTATATSTNVGSLRYQTTSNGSYVDMCMQIGAMTYTWINIVKNEW